MPGSSRPKISAGTGTTGIRGRVIAAQIAAVGNIQRSSAPKMV